MELEGWFPLSGRVRALVNAATEPALAMLPHFTETGRRSVPDAAAALPHPVRISGESFYTAEEIEGTFDIRRPKMRESMRMPCERCLLMFVARSRIRLTNFPGNTGIWCGGFAARG